MEIRNQSSSSFRRISRSLDEPLSNVARWVRKPDGASCTQKVRRRPKSGDPELIRMVCELCDRDRFRTYGYRRIHALLVKEYKIRVEKKTVRRIMKENRRSQKRLRYKPARPPHVGKMVAREPNRAWQIDMTSFSLSNLRAVYLIAVIDCYTRKIVGWSLYHRCRAVEWIAALRQGLEIQGIEKGEGLVLRSDNGSQPCSKRFVDYLSSMKIKGQYTGYNAPDDNAFVERVIRTIKEEEIWQNLYDTFHEAHEAIEKFVKFYNNERIHSSLNYKTPQEFEDEYFTLNAA